MTMPLCSSLLSGRVQGGGCLSSSLEEGENEEGRERMSERSAFCDAACFLNSYHTLIPFKNNQTTQTRTCGDGTW